MQTVAYNNLTTKVSFFQFIFSVKSGIFHVLVSNLPSLDTEIYMIEGEDDGHF